MAKTVVLALIVLLLVSGCVAPPRPFVSPLAFTFDSSLPPPPPQAFYGKTTLAGRVAPVGTVVQVHGVNVKLTSTNPITTTAKGLFGGPTMGEKKLAAQGWLDAGQPLTFSLNGIPARVSRDNVTWLDSIPFVSGVVTYLYLRAARYVFLPSVMK